MWRINRNVIRKLSELHDLRYSIALQGERTETDGFASSSAHANFLLDFPLTRSQPFVAATIASFMNDSWWQSCFSAFSSVRPIRSIVSSQLSSISCRAAV